MSKTRLRVLEPCDTCEAPPDLESSVISSDFRGAVFRTYNRVTAGELVSLPDKFDQELSDAAKYFELDETHQPGLRACAEQHIMGTCKQAFAREVIIDTGGLL